LAAVLCAPEAAEQSDQEKKQMFFQPGPSAGAVVESLGNTGGGPKKKFVHALGQSLPPQGF